MSELIIDPELTPEDIEELRRRARTAESPNGTGALAERIGVTSQAVGNWLRGEQMPNAYHTSRLIAAFGTPTRFGEYESTATYQHSGCDVRIGFTFIGDGEKVIDALTNVRQQINAQLF